MAIDTTTASPTAHRAAARSDASARHGAAGKATGAAPAGPAGGFSALLGALGADEDTSADTAATGGLLTAGSGDAGLPQAGDDASGLPTAADLAAAGLLAGGTPVATGAAVVDGAGMAVAGVVAETDTTGVASSTDPTDALRRALGASARGAAGATGDAGLPGATVTGPAGPSTAASGAAPSALPPTEATIPHEAVAPLATDAASSRPAAPAGAVPATAGAESGRADGMAGYRTIFQRMQQAMGHAPAGGRAAAAAASGTGTAATAVQAAADVLGGAALTAVTVATGPAATSTLALADGLHARLGGAAGDLVRTLLPADLPVGAGNGNASDARDSRDGGSSNNDRPADGTAVAAAVGFGAAPPSDAPQAAVPAAADAGLPADALVQTPEEQLASQIGRWVGQRTHSASLSLDTLGGAPVDVKISLSGSEAHVAFQTDQADTRALLGSAVDELRQLLQGEGLVLSGVSVGAGDGRAPGGGGTADSRGDTSGSRAATATAGIGRGGPSTGGTAATGPEPAPRRPAGATGGRALDLFV
ncbi:flagellar hook-length control protein FliK [uncultured Xylophilus sp.]|uniref:flagellar hook-length control protein FliK n=1 Tax=uncultured Xylophilus sp. TaxID=296832 RepID=UPI0025D33ED9|nr:flagellar hook-length control protein FliK [uncultured Xylophilus sp.]